ncbi:MAG: hypothetical protein LBM78_00110 [Clostridiales bacterium]|jgi:hypothetical protein|nr:hypothetical protein [Clostridiales bacterium]
MKKPFTLITALALALLLAVAFAGCAAIKVKTDTAPGSRDDGAYESSDGGVLPFVPGKDTGGADKADPDDPDDTGDSAHEIAAGQLTAGAWRDTSDFSLWLQQTGQGGLYADDYARLLDVAAAPINTRRPITAHVTANGAPVFNAEVELHNAQGAKIAAARSDAKGLAYLFPQTLPKDYTLTAKSGAFTGETEGTYTAGDLTPVEVTLPGAAARVNKLQLMLVLDTTGSMGDEINYLVAELQDVLTAVIARTGFAVSLAVMLYRDHGDDYVTSYADFSEQDNAVPLALLAGASASGGGDTPEAVDVALAEAAEKKWAADTTKILLHVADAPAHDVAADMTRFSLAVASLAAQGVRIVPVASSGIDERTEMLMRIEALLTGGVYTFITDHSGIGNTHLEPHLGAYTVEYLNALLKRGVEEIVTGTDIPAVPYRQAQTQAQQ